MNLVESVRLYIRRITKDVPGMKALLLDKETTAIISSIYTVSELLAEEIYLVDLIENKREKIGKLKAIVFVRPDVASIEFIKSELRDPPFEEYYIYFSNAVQPAVIDSLAAADMHEVVHELKEYFCDYIAINADLFNLNISDPILVSPTTWTASCLDRTVQGITGVLLSLKKKPVIQYEVNSSVAENLAIEIGHSIENEGQLYDFKKSDTAPLLLLLDRRNDPVTPLLTQWTYQAMVHEMIGIENGRVDMSATTGSDSTPQAKELVLSQEQDPFYRANMFLNFGDLGVNIRAYVNEFGQKHNSNKQVETLADMKSFVEQYPEFQKLSGNVSKHVALISELGKQVEARKLLEYGELEQSLGTTNMSTDAIVSNI